MPDYAYLLENRLSLNQRSVLEKVRDIARDHSMTVFLTGGAVRDLTTGFPVRDLDFTVQGNALKLKKALEKAGAEFWGEHEPTRTLFFWYKGVRFEVSSARREEYPKPGKPIYHWAPILEDLRRRDFTANAMALSLNEGSNGLLLDPLNGIADLESRTLRLVSPYGFIEDPSRLLRAVRLLARTGWEMDERTKTRYQNAREEDAISAITNYLKGYELEEIIHEEDALKALKALESEGWMKQIFPGWTTAKADTRGLEAFHSMLIDLLIQGIRPDLSAAHMELLTAKLPAKDRSSLKRLFPQPGFIKHWEHLERDTREFQKELLEKKNAAPSATWKLLTTYAPEPVLWLAYTSKNAQVQTRFKNFLTVWPEARQKIPTALMQEMRITPDLPGYDNLVQDMFLAFIDGKLQTEEEMRAFLAPHSPPAPPPPVTIRRTRAKRAKIVEEEDEAMDVADLHGDDHEDHEEEEHDDASIPLAPAKKALKPSKAEASRPVPKASQRAAVAEPSRKSVKGAPEEPAKAVAAKPVPAKESPAAKKTAPQKPRPPKKLVPAAKPAKKAARPAPKPAKKTAPKQVKKAALKPAKKPAPRPAKKAAPKKPAKPAKKKR